MDNSSPAACADRRQPATDGSAEPVEKAGRHKMAELKHDAGPAAYRRPGGGAGRGEDRPGQALHGRDPGRDLRDEGVGEGLLDMRSRELEAASTLVDGGDLGRLGAAAVPDRGGGGDVVARLPATTGAGLAADRAERDLSVATQGIEMTDTLGEKVAAFLGGYLGCQVGAVYFAPSRGALRQVGGFALPGRAGGGRAWGADQAGLRRRTRPSRPTTCRRTSSRSARGWGTARRATWWWPRPLPTASPNGAVELGFLQPVRSSRSRAARAAGRADRAGDARHQGSRRPARRAGGDAAAGRGAADAAGGAAGPKRGAGAAEPRAAGVAGAAGEPAGRAGADQRAPGGAGSGAGAAA